MKSGSETIIYFIELLWTEQKQFVNFLDYCDYDIVPTIWIIPDKECFNTANIFVSIFNNYFNPLKY